jgi:hypothetical protein
MMCVRCVPATHIPLRFPRVVTQPTSPSLVSPSRQQLEKKLLSRVNSQRMLLALTNRVRRFSIAYVPVTEVFI